MSLLNSLILGIIEGFTEFLPVSSTAHLILAAQALGLDQSAFVKTFEIAIQSGAILAVIVVYWRAFLDRAVLARVIAAFIPTAIIGFVLYKLIKNVLIGNLAVVLWALAVGGAAIVIFELHVRRRSRRLATPEGPERSARDEIRVLGLRKAAMIGLVQAVAVIPGVSRSAATVVGGLMAGMSRAAVVEFSFLLAVPTIVAATGYDLLKSAGEFSGDQTVSLAIGFVAAFVTALLGIRFFLSYIRRRSFIEFGVYRIALVVVVLLFILVM